MKYVSNTSSHSIVYKNKKIAPGASLMLTDQGEVIDEVTVVNKSEVSVIDKDIAALKVDTIESKNNGFIQVNNDVAIRGNVSADEASFSRILLDGVNVLEDLYYRIYCIEEMLNK